MPHDEHYDGIGGCWGISMGDVAKEGEGYCKLCEYYNSNLDDRSDCPLVVG